PPHTDFPSGYYDDFADDEFMDEFSSESTADFYDQENEPYPNRDERREVPQRRPLPRGEQTTENFSTSEDLYETRTTQSQEYTPRRIREPLDEKNKSTSANEWNPSGRLRRENDPEPNAYSRPGAETSQSPSAGNIPHRGVNMAGEVLPPVTGAAKPKIQTGTYNPTEEDFEKIAYFFSVNFLSGHVYLKSFLGMAINQATGRTLQEIFACKSMKPIFTYLVRQGYLEEVDNQHFRVLAPPSAQIFMEARDYLPR
ncbi:MAG: hypothetical protein NZ534_11510, partial [Bacteroidia bacterium]|nr:hypothetical protein [Bacteroidia bacterium]